jgi:TolB-like protein
MTPDIFLSYTREDQATAQRFAEGFEAQGFSVWWDVTLRSGEAYDKVTEAALRGAKAVVVLWSPRSVESRWVRAEATLADRHRTLVPARIEACDLPIMFELTQTADLCRWNGQAGDPAWRAFLTDVRRFVEAGAAPRRPPPTASAASAPAQQDMRPAIAVLPFVNRSDHEEDDVFADGMVEDVAAALSARPWIKVIASSATAAYRKRARDLRQIGQGLGVRYLLEGNVRRAGDALRVTAQLAETESGSILWTQKFARPLAQATALQEDLATEVAAHLSVQVERAERDRALKHPRNVSIWEGRMRATPTLGKQTRSGWEAAVADFKRAIETNPNYGGAHLQLAAAQGQLLHYVGDDPERVQEIVDNVRRARALDPDHPGALAGCAAVLIDLGKLEEGLSLAERAVAMNPDLELARLTLGSVLLRLGRSDEAVAELDAAERLAPDTPWAQFASVYRSVAHLQAGRLDQAQEAADRALRLFATKEALLQSVLCFARLNRWDRARDALRRLRDTDPEISAAFIERRVRGFYCGSNAVDEYVAIARKVWDETSSEAKSP